MSKNTSNGSEASDGSWFLEAVGAKPKVPTSSEAVADLTAENTLPDIPVTTGAPTADAAAESPMVPTRVMTFDGDPGTSTSSFHPVPLLPPEPALDNPAPAQESRIPDVASPSVSTEFSPPVPPAEHVDAHASGVDETQLSAALRSRRNFRWPVVIVAVLAIGAIGVAAWWLPQSVNDAALATRQSYYDAAVAVRNQLPASQTALDAITNPGSDPALVSAAATPVAELDTLSFELESVTAEPLPTTLPLIPTAAVDELVPLKDTGSILGASGSELGRRLGTSYIYRTSIPLLLTTGPLPVTATTQEVNEMSVRLASSLATDAGIVADLPDAAAFAEPHLAATAAVDRYADWQDEYLSALTSEDAEAADVLVREIETIRSDLAATNGEALLAFRTQADGDIVRLATELETYMAELTRP